MKTRRKRAVTPALTAFWDTSGIVPLCCYQAESSAARRIARLYAKQHVWWATSVEAVSSFNRLMREGVLSSEQNSQALKALYYLRHRWSEIQPTEELRDHAERLLAIHELRAADAFQLAAALVWCRDRPRDHHFIGADNDLLGAAKTEGFSVIPLLT